MVMGPVKSRAPLGHCRGSQRRTSRYDTWHLSPPRQVTKMSSSSRHAAPSVLPPPVHTPWQKG